MHVEFMNSLFGTEPHDAKAWMRRFAAGLPALVATKLEKFVATCARARLQQQRAPSREARGKMAGDGRSG